MKFLEIMATFMTGDTTGGVKKASGVTIGASISPAWAAVRDNDNTMTNWIICGYSPPESKTNVEVIATGGGTLEDVKTVLQDPKYSAQCLFGGFREGENRDKFAHLTWVGSDTGAMAKGRASLHKNSVLNELEGCIREENIIQDEIETLTSAEANLAAGAAATAGSAAAAAEALAPPSDPVSPHGETAQVLEASNLETKASKFLALGDEDFKQIFGQSRGEFEKLPMWKQNSAKKSKGYF